MARHRAGTDRLIRDIPVVAGSSLTDMGRQRHWSLSMSVKARLEDAAILAANGRMEGALVSVLIATAATSRKRYPKPKKGAKSTKATETDRGAFEAFVHSVMPIISRAENYNVKFRGQTIGFESLLYKFVRCELAHEAQLPSDVRFTKGTEPGHLRVEVTPNWISISETIIDNLAAAVRHAPENSSFFAPNPALIRAAEPITIGNPSGSIAPDQKES